MASDFDDENDHAAHAPPTDLQKAASARAAEVYHQYAPRGQFQPWALLAFPGLTRAYRFAYPTLICAHNKQAFLTDVRTGSLVQTIDIHVQAISYVDVNERHAVVCEAVAVHVYSRENGSEVLRIPADATIRCSQLVEDPDFENFVTVLSISSKAEKSRPKFIAGVFSYPLFTQRFHVHILRSSRFQGWPRSRSLI